MKIYLSGPMDEHSLPMNKNEEASRRTFFKRVPGTPVEAVAQEVTDEEARNLLTDKRARFRAVDPADEERLFPATPKVAGSVLTPGQQLLSELGAGGVGSLKPNTPAVEKDADAGGENNAAPVNPLVPVNMADPVVKNAINDPRKTK